MTAYLGQLAENRLLNVRTDYILGRRILYRYTFCLDENFRISWVPGCDPKAELEIKQDPYYRDLVLVKASPSQDEIADLGMADAFWGPSISPFDPLFNTPYDTGVTNYKGALGNVTPAQARGYYMCSIPEWALSFPAGGYGASVPERPAVDVQPPSTEPFCCPPLPDLPDPYVPSVANYHFMTQGPYFAGIRFNRFPPRAAFWDRAMGSNWSEMKVLIPNYVEIERVLAWYPFPEPFRRDYAFILGKHVIPAIREFAQTAYTANPAPLNETVIRIFLTMTVLSKFEAMANELNEYLEEQADNEKRNMIIRTVAVAVIGAVIGGALAAAAVGTTTSAMVAKGIAGISQEFSKERTASLAKDIEAASEALKGDNAAFAKEVKFSSDILKFLSEETGDLSKLPPDEQAKIAAGEGSIGILEVAGIGGAALLLLYLAGAFD